MRDRHIKKRKMINMDKFTKIIIKRHRTELRERFFKLPNFWWSVSVLIISVALMAVSYVFRKNNWLSSTLVSISCGGITGLTLYFLSNIRNNKLNRVKKEYAILSEMDEILHKILGFKDYYVFYRKSWGERHNVYEDGFIVCSLLDELNEVMHDMPYSLFASLGFTETDPLDYDKMRLIKEKHDEANDEIEIKKWIIETSQYVISIADTIHDPLHQRKDQIAFLDKYFF